MMKQTRPYFLVALLGVPFMLGNRSCEADSKDTKPSDDESLGDGSARSDDQAGDANPNADAGADADTTRNTAQDAGPGDEKLPTCEDIACGALPEGPKCADGSKAHPSCLRSSEGICAWKFLCGGVDGPAGEGSGAFCGGLAGIQCPKGEYCNFGSSCGATDQGGKCATITDNCTFEFSPVCGCDDKTYSNACAAASASVSVLRVGECGDPQPCSSCTDPAPGAPSYQCKDGIHYGGPACVARPNEACGWQFVKCPEELAP